MVIGQFSVLGMHQLTNQHAVINQFDKQEEVRHYHRWLFACAVADACLPPAVLTITRLGPLP